MIHAHLYSDLARSHGDSLLRSAELVRTRRRLRQRRRRPPDTVVTLPRPVAPAPVAAA